MDYRKLAETMNLESLILLNVIIYCLPQRAAFSKYKYKYCQQENFPHILKCVVKCYHCHQLVAFFQR